MSGDEQCAAPLVEKMSGVPDGDKYEEIDKQQVVI